MTIQEVMTHGKYFKRPCHALLMRIEDEYIVTNDLESPHAYRPDFEDLMADDWEIVTPPTVTYKLSGVTYNGKELYEKVEA